LPSGYLILQKKIMFKMKPLAGFWLQRQRVWSEAPPGIAGAWSGGAALTGGYAADGGGTCSQVQTARRYWQPLLAFGGVGFLMKHTEVATCRRPSGIPCGQGQNYLKITLAGQMQRKKITKEQLKKAGNVKQRCARG
jgi:hypothetical protein